MARCVPMVPGMARLGKHAHAQAHAHALARTYTHTRTLSLSLSLSHTGSGGKHQHCFCFHCTRTWGKNLPGGCGHGAGSCHDPGIQQLRKTSAGDSIEIGHIDGPAYLKWLNRKGPCPPTIFSTEPREVPGQLRQEDLKMVDRERLLEDSREGTT